MKKLSETWKQKRPKFDHAARKSVELRPSLDNDDDDLFAEELCLDYSLVRLKEISLTKFYFLILRF